MSFHGGFIDPHRPNPHGKDDARVIIYGYVPSLALSILGMAIFATITAVHTFQVVHYRWLSFLPIIVACIMEVVGYVFRYLSSHRDPYNITYFVVQYFFIVVAPVLISASIYMCLSRLLQWAESERPNRVGMISRLILWTFISADVVTTVVQITGAAMIGTKTHKLQDPTTANHILLVGLAIQSGFFAIFLGLYIRFVYIISQLGLHHKILPFLGALFAASILVFLRTLFRLAETAEGVFSYLSSHEAFFGSLEFAPIVLALTILAFWHPARWVKRQPGKEEKRQKGSTLEAGHR